MAWSYYTSVGGFLLLYSWLSSTHYLFAPTKPRQGYLRNGEPDTDPGRTPFSTGAYLDAAGAGTMVTVVAPVYEGDTFRGTVAVDLTLRRGAVSCGTGTPNSVRPC